MNSLQLRSSILELSNADSEVEQVDDVNKMKLSPFSLHGYSQVFDPLCW